MAAPPATKKLKINPFDKKPTNVDRIREPAIVSPIIVLKEIPKEEVKETLTDAQKQVADKHLKKKGIIDVIWTKPQEKQLNKNSYLSMPGALVGTGGKRKFLLYLDKERWSFRELCNYEGCFKVASSSSKCRKCLQKPS